MDERKQLKINVTPKAKAVVEAFADAFDMTELGVASRFYEWFGEQPRAVQKFIIGLTDGTEAEGIEAFIDSLAKFVDKGRSRGMGMKRAAKPMPRSGGHGRQS